VDSDSDESVSMPLRSEDEDGGFEASDGEEESDAIMLDSMAQSPREESLLDLDDSDPEEDERYANQLSLDDANQVVAFGQVGGTATRAQLSQGGPKQVQVDPAPVLADGVLLGKGGEEVAGEQAENKIEIVEMLAVDDDAEDVVGITQLPSGPGGAPGGFMNPELEERVTKMAQVENKELKAAVDKLEDDKEEAELRAEREMRMLQYKNMGGAGGAGPGGGRNLASDLEAQRKREEARRQMYNANDGEDGEIQIGLDDLSTSLGLFGRLYKRATLTMRKHFPLNEDLKRIDARFGSSVAAYFYFYRWMITNYMSITVLCVIFLIRHVLALLRFQEMDSAAKHEQYNSAGEPRLYFDWDSSYWGQVSGFLPKFLMFSSFNPGDTSTIYFDTNLQSGTSFMRADGSTKEAVAYDASADQGERMDYIVLLVLCNFVVLISAIFKWIREDRKAKTFGLFEDLDKQHRFAQVSLMSWDHSTTKGREVEDLKHSLLDQYFLMVHELQTENLQQSRTLKERAILVSRRLLSNILYLVIQGSSAWTIIYLTATSSQMSQQVLQAVNENSSLQWLLPVVTLLSGSIVPIAVSFINALLPTVAKQLTSFEKWDDAGYHTKLMLFRLFVAKILNAIIQIFSFLQLLDPYMLRGEPVISENFDRTTRINTEKRFVSVGSPYGMQGVAPRGVDECRADDFGSGIFQLVLTDFIISKLAFFAGPAIQKLVSKITKKPFNPPEFDVAKHMVDLLFFQQLCFMSFPFFPFGTVFILMMMFGGFRLQSTVLATFMAKPKKPWSAKDAANFFIKFYFFTFFVSVVISWFVLSNNNFPKACNLQEHITKASFNGTNPIAECFDSEPLNADDDLVCFLTDRSVAQIQSGEARAPGLEELRFWEEYFESKDNQTLAGNSTLLTEDLLRAELGFADAQAVSYSSLLVCSFSCGPFIYNVNASRAYTCSSPPTLFSCGGSSCSSCFAMCL
ncbi:Transmembrane channel-like protein 5, partial [Durusdinium trenchii]